jgi:Flp pilus assembly protein TadD
MNLLKEAVDSLARAAELIPDRSRIRFNYSLALRHMGRNADSLTEMHEAHKLDPNDQGILQTLAIFYIQEKQWETALPYAEELVKLVPNAPVPRQMLKQIQQAMKNK